MLYNFEATRSGHIRNAKFLLLNENLKTTEELAMMSDADVEREISNHYASFIAQSERFDSDNIYLIPLDKLNEFKVIHR